MAGMIDGDGYRIIRLRGRLYRGHILAWAYFYESWPVGLIDHQNKNRSDNRISNLREATYSQNNANTTTRARSGFRGVHETKKGRWAAIITVYGKSRYLGTYDDKKSAYEIYKRAAEDAFGNYAEHRSRQIA